MCAMRAHQQPSQNARMPPAASNSAGGSETVPLDLAAVRFHGQATAVSRYEAARERTGDAPWTRRVGFVERHHDGRLLVRGVFAGHYVYVDEDDRVSQAGAAEGGVAGALVGALLGPPGLAVGLTIGAVIGSQGGSPTDGETEPESLVARLREVVEPSSSAIVTVAPRTEIDEMLAALATDGTSVMRRTLSTGEQSALADSLVATPALQAAK
jgi:uncharacterized membrane protein